jgi:group I intron endonuclease
MIYSDFNCSGIYLIISPTNRLYIGQSTNVKRRLLKYKYGDFRSQPLLRKSIKKYGWKNHKVKLLIKAEKKDLNKLENKLGTRYNVLSSYNLNLALPKCDDTPYILAEESRAKLSNSRRGYIRSEESKRKQSEARKGNYAGINCPSSKRIGKLNPNWGRIGSKHPMSKPVINVITGETWVNAKECAIANNIPQSTLTKKLNGTTNNNTNFKYK